MSCLLWETDIYEDQCLCIEGKSGLLKQTSADKTESV